MSSDLTTVLVLLLFGLAIVILVVALLAYVSDAGRHSRREEYHPPPPPPPLDSDGTSTGGHIRWGDDTTVDIDEAPRATGGIVWGREEFTSPNFRPTTPQIRTSGEDELGSKKCPVCRRRFDESWDEVIVRCASCRTPFHAECRSTTAG